MLNVGVKNDVKIISEFRHIPKYFLMIPNGFHCPTKARSEFLDKVIEIIHGLKFVTKAVFISIDNFFDIQWLVFLAKN